MNANLDDPQLINALIENQNLLLSSSSSSQEVHTNEANFAESFLTRQEQQTIEDKIQSEDIFEEPSDFNIFDLLQTEERLEMASLLEAVNNSVDFVSYLPQISVNSTNKILENVELLSNLTAQQQSHHEENAARQYEFSMENTRLG